MTTSMHLEQQVARLARVRDDELRGLEHGAAARNLLARITADGDQPQDEEVTPHARVRRQAPRLALAASVVAAVTFAAVVGPSMLGNGTDGATSYASAAIDIRTDGRFLVAHIKDPLAEHARYVEAFRAVGKDVDIEFVPVSPPRVGRLLEATSGSGEISTELIGSGSKSVDCAVTPADCTMVVRISADSAGPIRYKLGRAAQPGESYQDPDLGVPTPPAPSRSGG